MKKHRTEEDYVDHYGLDDRPQEVKERERAYRQGARRPEQRKKDEMVDCGDGNWMTYEEYVRSGGVPYLDID